MATVNYVADGDQGCGAFNSPDWHKCVVAQLKDEEVASYIKEAFGVDIEGIDVRAEALGVIDGHSKGYS